MKKLIILLTLIPIISLAQPTGSSNRTEISGKYPNGGYITVSSDTGIRLHGSAVAWDDLMFPFTTGANAGTGYPTFSSDSLYYTFVVDTTGPSKCIMYFIVQMPHRWKAGSTIYPHVHYKHETAVGTPSFKIKYKWFNIGASAITPWKWVALTTTTGTTDNTNQVCNGGTISGVGKTVSSILLVQVYLGAAPTNVIAYQFDIHYQIDGFGSDQETSKK